MGHARRGFSLIEVVIALAMIAVMTAAIGLTIINQVGRAQAARVVQEIATLEVGAINWIQSTGKTAFDGIKLKAADLGAGPSLEEIKAVPSALVTLSAPPTGGYQVSGAGQSFTVQTVANAASDGTLLNAVIGAFGSRAVVSPTTPSAQRISVTFNQ